LTQGVAGRIDIVWDSQIDIVAILLDCHALIGFQVRYHRSFGGLMMTTPEVISLGALSSFLSDHAGCHFLRRK
jgi:hypothetical protein